ncbi:MAG TPA: hypothetical protein VJB13_01210 [Candidatus Nanoarchaeia archaeon]|nr:hypothetical protein [Candidatus Nanoarchaeia archaeon]
MTEKDYSIHDVYQSIGENENLKKVVDLLKEEGYLGNEENVLKWWYDSNNKRLGKSPDEVCKEGRQKELEAILTDALIGAQGG